MQWIQPRFKNCRFGFEITMFIYIKPRPVLMQYQQPNQAYILKTMQHACQLPEYAKR